MLSNETQQWNIPPVTCSLRDFPAIFGDAKLHVTGSNLQYTNQAKERSCKIVG